MKRGWEKQRNTCELPISETRIEWIFAFLSRSPCVFFKMIGPSAAYEKLKPTKCHAYAGTQGRQTCSCNSFAPSMSERAGWSAPCPGRFTPGEGPVQEAGWTPRPFWKSMGNLAPTGIRSPDRPARSEMLYRPHYPGLKKASSNKDDNVLGLWIWDTQNIVIWA
jgi:hypothetical protein